MVEEAEEWRAKLIEAVAEYDDELMEKFLRRSRFNYPLKLISVIRQATIDMKIVPMMCGSAFKNKGVQRLLDGIIRFLPAPADIAIKGINPDNGRKRLVLIKIEGAPFAALAFKIATDPFVGRLAL
jgi:elongation factor G